MKLMKNIMFAAAVMIAAPMAVTTPAMADEFPLVAGDYVSMSGIFIEDGGTLAYAQHLAGQWQKSQEFAKNKGWEGWSKKTNAQMDAESGDRAKFRKLRGSILLQEYKVR